MNIISLNVVRCILPHFRLDIIKKNKQPFIGTLSKCWKSAEWWWPIRHQNSEQGQIWHEKVNIKCTLLYHISLEFVHCVMPLRPESSNLINHGILGDPIPTASLVRTIYLPCVWCIANISCLTTCGLKAYGRKMSMPPTLQANSAFHPFRVDKWMSSNLQVDVCYLS